MLNMPKSVSAFNKLNGSVDVSPAAVAFLGRSKRFLFAARCHYDEDTGRLHFLA